jgi:hypothetical protein
MSIQVIVYFLELKDQISTPGKIVLGEKWFVWFGYWCLMSLSTIFQLYHGR